MPKVDGVGYSENTIPKIEALSRILDMHLQITQAVLRRHSTFRQCYRYVDATAGRGLSPTDAKITRVASFKPPVWSGVSLVKDGKLLGSPLVFLTVAHSNKVKIAYQADLIECETANIQELQVAISKYCAECGWDDCEEVVKYHTGCYQDVMPRILGGVDDREFGLIYVDPSGDSPDFELISRLAQARPKMEILLYLSATNLKREHSGKLSE
jgi:hypothetical protein